jgi:hypothetical protein
MCDALWYGLTLLFRAAIERLGLDKMGFDK